MKELRLTGGARIGWANATFPFATLTVNKDCLKLNTSMLGSLTFQPSDIISIEPYTLIPLLGQGIRINHKVNGYKKRVIFWTFKSPDSVVRQIEQTGFLDHQHKTEQEYSRTTPAKQPKSAFPLKKGFVIIAIVVWNLLLLIDLIPFFLNGKSGIPIGKGFLTAAGLLFLTGFLSLLSGSFRHLILKKGKQLIDIKTFAVLAMIISGILLLQFIALFNIGT